MNKLLKNSLYIFGILILISFVFAFVVSIFDTRINNIILLIISILTYTVMPIELLIVYLRYNNPKSTASNNNFTSAQIRAPNYYSNHPTLGQNSINRSINHDYPSQRKRRVTPKMKVRVLERDNYTCQMCGKTVKDGVKLEVDHIHPFSKGGSDDISNLRTLCQECNRGKYDMILPNYKKL